MAKQILYLALVILVLAAPRAALGQTTEFTFQGRLLDNTLPPTASYDFEFRLYDAETDGTEIGLVSRPAVQVNSGVFSVRLDFGAQFDGSPRFLEIAVKPAGSPDPMLVLAPRQPISSTPYSIRSLNATAADVASDASQLGGVDAAEYVQDSDPRMDDARPPAPGSGNYIQNQSAGTQPLASFDISGTGTANLFNAGTQFNIGNNRILSSPGTLNTFVGINNGAAITSGERNTFVGRNTGVNTTTGSTNTFVGSGAGFENISGANNSFYGYNSGLRVTAGSRNAFFGVSAGSADLTGNDNSFFGYESGLSTTGSDNSFFGSAAGRGNTSGTRNVFLGYFAGSGTTTGINNSFVGQNAGIQNVTGSHNVAIGSGSGFTQPGLTFATAIGPGTLVSTNNTIQLGRSSGEERVLIPGDLQVNGDIIGNLPSGSGSYIQNTSTLQASSNFNISGTGAANIFNAETDYRIGGDRALLVSGSSSSNTLVGVQAGSTNTSGSFNTFVGWTAGQSTSFGRGNTFIGAASGALNTGGDNNTVIGFGAGLGSDFLVNAAAIGAGSEVSTSNTIVLGRSSGVDTVVVPGNLSIGISATAGSQNVCRNVNNFLSTCSSSIRYKSNIEEFRPTFNIADRLRPVSFVWKDGGMHDLGLIAEEVAEIEPLLATYNESGEVEGVKYDRIGVVLINVVKEQQQQLDAQRKEIDALKAIVCELKPGSGACR